MEPSNEISGTFPDDYRRRLRRELEERCRRDARYSQRAFARDLGIAPHRLSEILRGKQGISRFAGEKVAQRLGLGKSERERFLDAIESVHARSPLKRAAARARLVKRAHAPAMEPLEADTFRLIGDWYHLAILELLKLRGAKSSPAWIGRALGIGEIEASLALSRLERLGFLKLPAAAGGKIRLLKPTNTLAGGVPSEAVKAFHRQVLERATAALFTQPVEEREYSTSFLAVERERLPEAKALLQEFWGKFHALMTPAAAAADDVYCLGIQLFHLTNHRHLGTRETSRDAH